MVIFFGLINLFLVSPDFILCCLVGVGKKFTLCHSGCYFVLVQSNDFKLVSSSVLLNLKHVIFIRIFLLLSDR